MVTINDYPELQVMERESRKTTEFFTTMLANMEMREHETLKSKGRDYTQGSDNRIKNFEDLANELGTSPMLIWFVYFKKHIDAIKSFIKTGHVESEGIAGPIMDARNYLALFQQIVSVYDPDALSGDADVKKTGTFQESD